MQLFLTEKVWKYDRKLFSWFQSYSCHMLQIAYVAKWQVAKSFQNLPKVAKSCLFSCQLGIGALLLTSMVCLATLVFFAYWTKPIDQFFATQSLSNMHNCFGGTLARIAFSFTLCSVKKSNCLDNKEKQVRLSRATLEFQVL